MVALADASAAALVAHGAVLSRGGRGVDVVVKTHNRPLQGRKRLHRVNPENAYIFGRIGTC